MKKKRVMALILASSMAVTMMAGCGSSKSAASSAGTSEQPAATDSAASTAAAAGSTEKSGAASGADISEPVTLTWYLDGSDNVKDDSAVIAKANEYLKEKLNVTLKPIWGTWGDFDQNSVLSINSGDDVDVYFTSSWTANEYNTYAKKGAFLRLDKEDNNLIDKYCRDLWKVLPDVLVKGAKINGSDGYGIYAIPGDKDFAEMPCWDVNVKLLKKYGYTIDDIKKADYYSFGDILKKVKAGEGKNFYPLLMEGSVADRIVEHNTEVTGDSTGATLGYYFNQDDPSKPGPEGNKFVSKYESDSFKKFCEQSRKYYEAGYIDPAMGNAQQCNDKRSADMTAGNYLINTQCSVYGYDTQASAERGFEVAEVQTCPIFVDTASSQGAMMAVSSASKNPERAVMFLNLLNTDPYLMTLLNYGIEGTHYTLTPDKCAKFTDARNSYQPWTNGMGNVTILPPVDGNGADYWTKFADFYKSAVSVPDLGFAVDQTDLQTTSAALDSVCAQYSLALEAGTVDPDKTIPEFVQKLKSNGIDNYVKSCNDQLTKFMSAQGK